MITVFIAYSHQDESYRGELEKHLAVLKRQRLIESWHDRRIAPGEAWAGVIHSKLNQADLIILLVSPDFLASDYCFDVEMQRALERHAEGTARVIPVILRHCDWENLPLGKLQALPTDGKPVARFPDPDEAFLQIVAGIRAALQILPSAHARPGRSPTAPSADPQTPEEEAGQPGSVRSSNLRVKRAFTDHDRDSFLESCFEYIARFFENSLAELETRNSGIRSMFKRVDAQRFSASAYRDGKLVTQCHVSLQQGQALWGKGIAYSSSEAAYAGINEQLSVADDGYNLHLRTNMGGFFVSGSSGDRLTPEGGAEALWSRFIAPMQ